MVYPNGHKFANRIIFPNTVKMFQKQVDEIACLSSKEQKLCGTLTSINNIINENYTIYQIGEKNLYLYDKIKLHYGKYFYILEKFQKRGLGIKLFNFMLKDNDISAFCLCYDNPSYKLQNFLKKYFSPCVLIKQPNHFVIFSNYFKNVSIKKRLDENDEPPHIYRFNRKRYNIK
ncbi:hypothetical protein PFMG_01844 [Plasmodium falciparum IGH-CR14]|uniref:N-acetyltransferase domain-containing protein n=1 Tax=Plasmodium falciparum IGH-CR14 TaxID=580059 RepID=A0A0L1I8Y0_PLAFA|nr:hypothetical protein PFMG_01844 [Plasmodium falciparum IGH-CR14]